MDPVEKMFEVNDSSIATMMVRNVLSLDIKKLKSGLMKEIKDSTRRHKVRIILTQDEWNAINTINWFIYEYLFDKLESSQSIVERSSIERFMYDYESAIMKINEAS